MSDFCVEAFANVVDEPVKVMWCENLRLHFAAELEVSADLLEPSARTDGGAKCAVEEKVAPAESKVAGPDHLVRLLLVVPVCAAITRVGVISKHLVI